MADTGWKDPNICETQEIQALKPDWTDYNNAKTQDDADADCAMVLGQFGDYLVGRDFSFGIPGGATINGVEVRYDRWGQDGDIEDYSVRMWIDGVAGDEKATVINWSSSDDGSYDLYGGPSDDWGNTLTPAIVNTTTFGCALSPENTNGIDSRDGHCDHIQMKVYYTEAGGSIIKANNKILKANSKILRLA